MQRFSPRPVWCVSLRARFRGSARSFSGLLAGVVCASILGVAGAAGVASAAYQTYHIHFTPSPSPTAVGYTLHLGATSGEYIADLDIGQPDEGQNLIVYQASFNAASDLYVAISSYDAAGNSSAYSNELVVAAAEPDPPPAAPAPEPETDPTPAPPTTPTPPPSGSPATPPISDPPTIDGVRLGITADASGLLHTVLADGSLAYLTLDTLASSGDLRPARCDLDGDGHGDLLLGFGGGSAGQIALIYLEDDAVARVASLQAGDAAYHEADGQTRPACGDVDGDGRAEIVVGMGAAAEETLQVFDDEASGFRAFTIDGSTTGTLRVPVTRSIDELGAPLVPALGDIDGDGRDELIVGFGRAGLRDVAILDDGLSDFAGHASLGTQFPLIRIVREGENPLDPRKGGTFPATGDWDGDGLDEIAVGFGPGTGGWLAFLDDATKRNYKAYPGFLMIPVGRDAYRASEGAAYPAFGDIDNDGLDELVVAFGPGAAHEVQLFDDQRATGVQAAFGGGKGFVSTPDEEMIWVASPAP